MAELLKRKTSGLAIGSLICGFFFIIPLLGIPFSLAAIILGVIALVMISKNKETAKGNGLAIAGIVMGGVGIVIIPIFALLAAIAIPNLLRARAVANEAAAIASLRAVSTAAETFYAVNKHYPSEFRELAYAKPPYIHEALASETRQGYTFKIVDTGSKSTFLATAVPESVSTGIRSFCAVEDGTVRANLKGEAIPNYDSCKELNPIASSY